MFHLHPGSFGIGFEDPGEGRERMHRIALHEARIASDHHAGIGGDIALARELRAARLRRATTGNAGNGVADLAACCA
jgi:hypothetical protein